MAELIPDPIQTVVLMIWFAVMYVILKNLLFVPYLELLDQRHADTGGADAEFSSLRDQIEHKQAARKTALDQAREKALDLRQGILQDATTQADSLTSEAQAGAMAKVKAAREDLEKQKKDVLGDIDTAVQPLTKTVVTKLMGRAL